jgi:hypothetical protein
MSNGHKTNSPYWDVQVSIANGVAKMQSPSLAKLHHEILEEMGTPPSQELIDYFLEQVEVPDEELIEYYRYIGKYDSSKGDSPAATSHQPAGDLIDKLLQQGNPSVLTFRQAYLQQHGIDPSEQETREFLERKQNSGRQQVNLPNKQQYLQFAESIALGPHPTVLKLRTDFSKQFGTLPSEDVIKYFLDRMHNAPQQTNTTQESDAKINFAKTVANGLISTVLQFRNAYEKVYSEEPSNEIIDVFIKNLSQKPR